MNEQNQQQTLPPQQPPIPPQNVNPVPPPQHKNWIKWVLIIVFVVLLASITTYFVLTFQSQKPPPPQIVQTTPSPTPTPDPTANWKTYTNTKYGFTFKHPSLDDTCCDVSPPSQNLELIASFGDKSTVLPQSDKPFNGFSVYVEPNPNKISFKMYLNNAKLQLLQTLKNEIGPRPLQPPQESSILIGSRTGTMLSNYRWAVVDVFIPLLDNQRIVVIAKEGGENFTTLFDQILSTFKFTE